MRPQELREMKNWRKAVLCGSPAVFHVLGFVHTYGQFDLEILVRARLGHSHLVKFWLFGAVGSWVEDDLHSKQKDVAAISFSYVSVSLCVYCRYSYVINFWNHLNEQDREKQYRRVGPVSQRGWLPSCQSRCSSRKKNLVTNPRSKSQQGHHRSTNASLYHFSP